MFLDESGDLGFKRSDYFVIASLCTENPKPIYNCIKRIKKSTTKKYYKNQELHFSRSEHKIRRRVLECLSSKDIQISFLILTKDDFQRDPSRKIGIIKDTLFVLLISDTLDKFKIKGNPNIIIDRYLSKQAIENFNQLFHEVIKINYEEIPIRKDIETMHMHSYENKGLQAVDFIAGAIHFLVRERDPSLYNIILPKIGRGVFVRKKQ